MNNDSQFKIFKGANLFVLQNAMKQLLRCKYPKEDASQSAQHSSAYVPSHSK